MIFNYSKLPTTKIDKNVGASSASKRIIGAGTLLVGVSYSVIHIGRSSSSQAVRVCRGASYSVIAAPRLMLTLCGSLPAYRIPRRGMKKIVEKVAPEITTLASKPPGGAASTSNISSSTSSTTSPASNLSKPVSPDSPLAQAHAGSLPHHTPTILPTSIPLEIPNTLEQPNVKVNLQYNTTVPSAHPDPSTVATPPVNPSSPNPAPIPPLPNVPLTRTNTQGPLHVGAGSHSQTILSVPTTPHTTPSRGYAVRTVNDPLPKNSATNESLKNNPPLKIKGKTIQHPEIHRQTCTDPNCCKYNCTHLCGIFQNRHAIGHGTHGNPANISPNKVVSLDGNVDMKGQQKAQNAVMYEHAHETTPTPENLQGTTFIKTPAVNEILEKHEDKT